MKKFLEKHRRVLGFLFWVWFLFIHIITVIPDLQAPKTTIKLELFRPDYLFHFFAYFGISFLFIAWYMNPLPERRFLRNLGWLLAGLTLCLIAEISQLWIPGRSYNTIDLVYNSSGLITGYLFTYWFIFRFLNRRKSPHDLPGT